MNFDGINNLGTVKEAPEMSVGKSNLTFGDLEVMRNNRLKTAEESAKKIKQAVVAGILTIAIAGGFVAAVSYSQNKSFESSQEGITYPVSDDIDNGKDWNVTKYPNGEYNLSDSEGSSIASDIPNDIIYSHSEEISNGGIHR